MSRVEALEPQVHGRGRNLDSLDDLHFGVNEEMLYARKIEPVEGAQWTGIVTAIAVEMLRSNRVDAVICVHRSSDMTCCYISFRPDVCSSISLACQRSENKSL